MITGIYNITSQAVLCSATLIFFCANVSATTIEGPPHFGTTDEHGVNLVSGQLSISVDDLAIGSGSLMLRHSVQSYNNLFRHFQDNFTGLFEPRAGNSELYFGNISDAFGTTSWPRISALMTGGTFINNGGTERVYVMNDGTRIYYSTSIHLPFGKSASDGQKGSATRVVYPNGLEVMLHFTSRPNPNNLTSGIAHRIQSVTSSSGYQLKYHYISDNPAADMFDWSRPSKITALNSAVEYCDPQALSCSFTNAWPTVSYQWPTAYSANFSASTSDFKVTFPTGEKSIYRHGLYCVSGTGLSECSPKSNNNMRISKIIDSTSQGAATREFEYRNAFYCTGYLGANCNTLRFGMLVKSQSAGKVLTYQYSVPPAKYVPIEAHSKGVGDMKVLINHMDPNKAFPYEITDQRRGLKASLTHGTKVSRLEYLGNNGKSIKFSYDIAGNITERRETAHGGTLADNVFTAGYNNNCNNEKTKNKPAWTKDANGNQTDYSYHCSSGELAVITSPADRNGIRPQIRYSYSQKYAWIKTAGGSFMQASSPVWLLTRESYCRTSAATSFGCSVAGDEVTISYDYGSNKGPNNLLLRARTVTADNQSHTTCYDYDIYGNKIAETAPKAGVVSCY